MSTYNYNEPRSYLSAAPKHAWFISYQSGGENYTTYTDGWNGPVPIDTLGEQITLPLVFRAVDRPNRDPPISARQTERYRAIKDICKHANKYHLFPEPTDEPGSGLMFSETSPGGAPSLLLKVVPGYDTAATSGLWVLVDGVEDETMLENVACELSVSATIVAHVADYQDRQSVTGALEYPGL